VVGKGLIKFILWYLSETWLCHSRPELEGLLLFFAYIVFIVKNVMLKLERELLTVNPLSR
jgi:hypothetical protein